MRVTTLMAIGLAFGGAACSEALAANHPTHRIHPRAYKADRLVPAYPTDAYRAYSRESDYPPGGREIYCFQCEE